MHGGSITCVTPYGEQVEVVENMTEEEFLGELAEKTTSVTLREFTPDGVRISYNLQGKIRGQYDADHMETVDAIFKPDGTYEFESLGMDQTVDGEMLLIKGKGTGRQVSPTSVQAEDVEREQHEGPRARDKRRTCDGHGPLVPSGQGAIRYCDVHRVYAQGPGGEGQHVCIAAHHRAIGPPCVALGVSIRIRGGDAENQYRPRVDRQRGE